MAGSIPDRLEGQLASCINQLGFDLEHLDLTPAGKRRVLRVAVDKDGGVTVDDIADVTRAVSELLDESDSLGSLPYTLEVGSRGVANPLTLPRHWRRNTGRLVHVTLSDGTTREGRIGASDEESTEMITSAGTSRLPYDEIEKALIRVELNRKDI